MEGKYDRLLLDSMATHRSFRSVLFAAGLPPGKVKAAQNLRPQILARLIRQERIKPMNATEIQEIITNRRTAALRALQSLGETPSTTRDAREAERHSLTVLAALARIPVADGNNESRTGRLIDLVDMNELLSDDEPESATAPALLDGREA